MTAIPVTPRPVTPRPVTPSPVTPSPVTPIPLEPTPPAPVPAQRVEPRSARTAAPAHIPLTRIVSVELRKSIDTRSGFWLLASIGIASLLATGGVVIWAARDQLTYSTFTLAIGFPMAVILPVIAILSVTAEWTQRTGLTTFTLVPHRGRIMFAKAIVAVSIAVASMLVAFVIGALGNLAAAALAGRDAVWDQGVTTLAAIVLGNILVVLIGFMLGVLIRNSTAAIVAYFVYAFVAPPLLELLAANQAWFHDLYPWVDPNVTQNLLFHGPLAGQQWLQLAVTTAAWLVAPLLVGLWTLRRSEVK